MAVREAWHNSCSAAVLAPGGCSRPLVNLGRRNGQHHVFGVVFLTRVVSQGLSGHRVTLGLSAPSRGACSTTQHSTCQAACCQSRLRLHSRQCVVCNAVSAFPLEDYALQSGSATFVMLQAYYVIKAAQEREELQREGDILDGHIQTAEREVRGLEATLAKLNLVNSDMGKSFRYYSPLLSSPSVHDHACASQSTALKHSPIACSPLVCLTLCLTKPLCDIDAGWLTEAAAVAVDMQV